MQVTVHNYIELANRTNTPNYHEVVQRLNILSERLEGLCGLQVEMGNRLDYMKKMIFYGKHFSEYTDKENLSNIDTVAAFNLDQNNKDSIDILHGIIGIATESSELMEALNNINENGQIDKVNVAEEISDVLWYCAIILKAIDMDFESVMQLNINKLIKRFPDGFTENHANERNLDAERDTMEKVVVASKQGTEH